VPLSAADVMILASSNEGWANVLLESMACGTPVVASDVGGNREVVADATVGCIFDLEDAAALDEAVGLALSRPWDRAAIVDYARRNSWDARVEQLVTEFRAVAAGVAA
jgi:glycosyltransferase involved in cell wall biosynthesis